MTIGGRIQRYIFRESLAGLMLTLGVIVLAIVMVDVVEQMRTIGARTQIGIDVALRLTLLQTPKLILETLPFATLVGGILTYTRLNKRSEIAAMRAAGVSAWAFLAPSMLIAFLCGVIMVTGLDPLATRMNEEFVSRRMELLGGRGMDTEPKGAIWLGQGGIAGGAAAPQEDALSHGQQAIITAQRVVGRAEGLENATFYYFAPDPDDPDERMFERRVDAKRANLVPGFWQLEDVIENTAAGESRKQDKMALPTGLRAETLLSRFAASDTIAFWDLPYFISQTRIAGLDSGPYALKFHTLLATPALMVAMSLIGAVVCLRLARSGGLSRLIALGATSGFALYFVTRISGGLAASGATSPEAAAWCPPLIALFAVLAVIAHAEDG